MAILRVKDENGNIYDIPALKGDKGDPGYTPVKGEDYFTPEEVAEITAEATANAKPADWMPTAEEVGARPDTWMPTAEEVGARPNTWTPTADDVGARPDTWMPTASDVGASPSNHTHTPSSLGALANTGTQTLKGSFSINDANNEGFNIGMTRKISATEYKLLMQPTASYANIYYYQGGTLANTIQLSADSTNFRKPVAVASGGTGAVTGNVGLQNLFAAGATVLSSHQYGTTLPTAGTKGRLFFKVVE